MYIFVINSEIINVMMIIIIMINTILNEMIQSQMKSARLNTVGFIITNKASTIFQNVYTEKDKASNTTPFILGSVSKSFTALGILKLNIYI